MLYNKEGSYNTAIGRFALYGSSSASYYGGNSNTVVGSGAAGETGGSNNVIIGRNAFANSNYGGNNTIIGTNACLGSTNPNTGYSNSILIGYEAGKTETEGDRLYIENSSSSTPLIYGEFDNDYLLINGTQEISEVLNLPHTGTAIQIEGIDVLSYNNTPSGIQFVWGEGGVFTNYNSFSDNIVISPDLTTPRQGNLRITDLGASIILESTAVNSDAYIQLKDNGAGLQWTLRRDDDDSGNFEISHNTK